MIVSSGDDDEDDEGSLEGSAEGDHDEGSTTGVTIVTAVQRIQTSTAFYVYCNSCLTMRIHQFY